MVGELNNFYTHKGVKVGLRDHILNNVPKGSVQDIKDNRYFFAKVTPLASLVHLDKKAEAVYIVAVNDMLAERDTVIDFESNVTLKIFSTAINNIFK